MNSEVKGHCLTKRFPKALDIEAESNTELEGAGLEGLGML